jgi:hypothetical protein
MTRALRTSLLRARNEIDEALLALDTKEQANDDGYFSSLNLPPDILTRERFAKIARSIPGANLAGRVWRVPSAAWWAHRRALTVPSPKPPPRLGDDAVDLALAAHGYRRGT